MFDVGWQELFVVAILALIIVGPKDFPRAIRTMTAWIRKARKLGREFQAGVNKMVQEAELEDVKRQLIEGKNLGSNVGEKLSQSLVFDEDLAFNEGEDKTLLPSTVEGELSDVIDVVVQDVNPAVRKDGGADETVMPILEGKNDTGKAQDQQPIISLDDDVMPVISKKTDSLK